MKILSAQFIKSCYEAEQLPRDRLPELAFVGRSNVGKSSLINSLLHRRGLAKVSRTPGKTRSINFFRVTTSDQGRGLYVVDLPGYGYARVAKSVHAQWGPMIEAYLTTRSELRGIVLLADARRVERQDWSTLEWLEALGRPIAIVTTKVDKLSRSEQSQSGAAIREALSLRDDARVIQYSSMSHEGRDALWRVLRDLVR